MISSIRTVTATFIVAVAMAVGLQHRGHRPRHRRPRRLDHRRQDGRGQDAQQLVGETSTGREVTGSFTPKRFVEKNGKVLAKGVIRGEYTTKSGATKHFKVKRAVPVKKANGTPLTARSAQRADCDVLHLVLGPLDLNVLGLQVNLNKVLLDIVAQSGAGNLLGNLLCAVVGLLDGGGLLSNLLGQITDLLNQILGRLALPA